jgi:hypothetical protein
MVRLIGSTIASSPPWPMHAALSARVLIDGIERQHFWRATCLTRLPWALKAGCSPARR